jgi:hypothetical protein
MRFSAQKIMKMFRTEISDAEVLRSHILPITFRQTSRLSGGQSDPIKESCHLVQIHLVDCMI